MGSAPFFGQMAGPTKASTKTTKSMVRESLDGPTAVSTTDSGRMANNMAWEL